MTMSDDDKTIDEPEADALFDEGNLVSFPEPAESDPVIDLMYLSKQNQQSQQMVRDLERQLQQKQYELDLNGGLARLNIAGDILTGYAAAGNLPALHEGRIKPLDTVGRNTLQLLGNRTSVKMPTGDEATAGEVLLRGVDLHVDHLAGKGALDEDHAAVVVTVEPSSKWLVSDESVSSSRL
jgi:hypothetical protein